MSITQKLINDAEYLADEGKFYEACLKAEQAIDQLKQRIFELEDAIRFYLDLSKTGRVEPDNILDKFKYIGEANDRFKKLLEEK